MSGNDPASSPSDGWQVQAFDSPGSGVSGSGSPSGADWRDLITLIRMRVVDSGAVLVRGFCSPGDSPQADRERFLSFGAQFGRPRRQDRFGNVLREVVDRNVAFVGHNRGSETAEAIDFHTDGGDITLLWCLQPAERGGSILVQSVESVHIQMRNHHHESLPLLFEPWYFDRRVAQGPLVSLSPILTKQDGILMAYYLPHLLRSAPSKTGIPLNTRQEIALNALHNVTNFRLRASVVDLKLGDLLILNNYTTLHARTAYTDGDSSRRCIMRLWLRSSLVPKLPIGFKYGPETVAHRHWL